MNVLSIDFDFFVNATDKAQYFFPDGGREYDGDGLNQIVWAGLYLSSEKNSGDPLRRETHVLEKELMWLRNEVIVPQRAVAKVVITDSHRFAYSAIKNLADEGDRGPFTVYNVDFHHDTFTKCPEEIHCGNWLKHLLNEGIVTHASWIRRENSITKGHDARLLQNGLKDLAGMDFDLIFICRSGWWTPPHLDEFFIRYLLNPIRQWYDNFLIEDGIDKSRFVEIKRILPMLREQEKYLEEFTIYDGTQ